MGLCIGHLFPRILGSRWTRGKSSTLFEIFIVEDEEPVTLLEQTQPAKTNPAAQRLVRARAGFIQHTHGRDLEPGIPAIYTNHH